MGALIYFYPEKMLFFPFFPSFIFSLPENSLLHHTSTSAFCFPESTGICQEWPLNGRATGVCGGRAWRFPAPRSPIRRRRRSRTGPSSSRTGSRFCWMPAPGRGRGLGPRSATTWSGWATTRSPPKMTLTLSTNPRQLWSTSTKTRAQPPRRTTDRLRRQFTNVRIILFLFLKNLL